jgi:glycosyltransferase involved in cell wall biosynthesis
MKILLIGNYQSDKLKSMDLFATMLQTHLQQLGHEVRLILPTPWFGKLISRPKVLKKWLAYIDKFILFPFTFGEALSWADVIHICDHGNALYTRYLQNKPHIVTCHDLSAVLSGLNEFSEHKTGWTGRILQKMIVNGLNKAQKIACDSEKTKNDVIRLCSINQENVSAIYIGLNYPYSPMANAETQQRLIALGVPEGRFLLHVGANHWYKNRPGVLAIFSQLIQKLNESEFYLVMVGEAMTDEMRSFIQSNNLSERVIELVDIDNENLRSLYSSATALLFPSFQEGFGWPIIEAQACGCPVFTSNRPPMNYIGGDAAIYIEPDNHEQAAETILHSLPILETLKLKGLTNCQRFTSEKMINEYIALYQQAIDERTSNTYS